MMGLNDSLYYKCSDLVDHIMYSRLTCPYTEIINDVISKDNPVYEKWKQVLDEKHLMLQCGEYTI